ncbi:MAG TPA: twin-arginine translocase subunit TatC [Solirubrobacteraceae bacterium]|nr:twin-arginine translocase subunit TatC [Solirubrobacteraceae bacterium]
MAAVLRPVSHDAKLSLVEHLDELRTRLIVSVASFIVLFGLCFWQNDRILDVVNRPFEQATVGQTPRGPLAKTQRDLGAFAADARRLADAVAADPDASPATRAAARDLAISAERVAGNPTPAQREPVTLGVAEPFTATFKVAAYAALLLALPILLWQAYAFILPAFSRRERQAAVPLMAMVPLLFIGGAVFAYFVVLPSAIRVLQNFNADNFDILIQAKDLYRFTILTCMAMGALFQVPIGILLLTRMEILTVAQLRANRRYAVLIIAVLAMLLPGTDPITMLLSMAPLVVLYEGSILLAALLDRRAARRTAEPDDEPETLALPDDDD